MECSDGGAPDSHTLSMEPVTFMWGPGIGDEASSDPCPLDNNVFQPALSSWGEGKQRARARGHSRKRLSVRGPLHVTHLRCGDDLGERRLGGARPLHLDLMPCSRLSAAAASRLHLGHNERIGLLLVTTSSSGQAHSAP
jgi:hypothetical protein